MPVLSLTLNVAIDQTIKLDRLIPGAVHRANVASQNAGGKGINVSSCLADWGCLTAACGFLGRDNSGIFEQLFQSKRIIDQCLRVPGQSRVNVKIVDQACTTDLNLPGPRIAAEDLETLREKLASLAPEYPLAVLAGSLPPGCPSDIYRRLLTQLNEAGVTVILDASEKALHQALQGESLPYAIKPNLDELSQLAGRKLNGPAEVLLEARQLLDKGLSLVVVSMGSEGALFVSANDALLAKGQVEKIASTVGAGDAMVAGIAAVLSATPKASLERIARLSTAFSISKLGLVGPNLPDAIKVEIAATTVQLSRVQ